MPTDEQRMEQFEEAIKRDCPAITADDFDGWDADTETYARQTITNMWLGYQARDAEVQALREALTAAAEDLTSEIIAKHGPIQAHPDTFRRFNRDMEPVYRARRLLAGGEEGEVE